MRVYHAMCTIVCSLGKKGCELTALMSKDNLDFAAIIETWYKDSNYLELGTHYTGETKSERDEMELPYKPNLA